MTQFASFTVLTNVPTRVETLVIAPDVAGQRVDNFLLNYLKGVPRSHIYRLLRSGEVRLNKKRVKPDHRLCAADQLRIPPVRRAPPTAPQSAPAALRQQLTAAIVYEDERLLVIDKPAGLAVHGGSGVQLGLIEALRPLRPQNELELVHRLDRDTSGCLLISKRRSMLRWLHEQLRHGTIEKHYQALLVGSLPKSTLTVDAPLRKNQLRSGERVVTVDMHGGRAARTVFHSQQQLGAMTLVTIRLHTGRTHQIRVHAAHLAAPVAGDQKYGDAQANRHLRGLGLNRLFLHATELCIPLPEDRASAPLRVRAPLPQVLAQVLSQLDH